MLGGIALQYGLTVDDLLAANPEVDPAFLKIGSTLVVPLDPEGMPAEPTPVPLPILLEEPDCYPTGDGGAFCLILATNMGEISVENVSVKISIISEDGERVTEWIALLPLNVLPAGESLPALAFVTALIEPGTEVQVELISALPLLEENTRYMKAQVELEEVIVEPEGDQAAVQGQIVIPDGSEPPDYLWLAAVAYGDSGEVIGVRKWEAPQDESCPEQVETESGLVCVSFDLAVFSLGPDIEQVEVYVEAGYQPEPEAAP